MSSDSSDLPEEEEEEAEDPKSWPTHEEDCEEVDGLVG